MVRAGGALAACGLGLTLLIGQAASRSRLRAGRRRPLLRLPGGAYRPRRGTPGLPPSAAIAAVCTVGYLGFLLGPPMIGGLAELIGLPGALGLVVLLCALIAALGSRAPVPDARTSAPSR